MSIRVDDSNSSSRTPRHGQTFLVLDVLSKSLASGSRARCRTSAGPSRGASCSRLDAGRTSHEPTSRTREPGISSDLARTLKRVTSADLCLRVGRLGIRFRGHCFRTKRWVLRGDTGKLVASSFCSWRCRSTWRGEMPGEDRRASRARLRTDSTPWLALNAQMTDQSSSVPTSSKTRRMANSTGPGQTW